jgi:hypothetical protein
LFSSLCIVVEKHGRDSKDDSKLRPITCFIEGAIHNILVQVDDAQNVCFSCIKFDYQFVYKIL